MHCNATNDKTMIKTQLPGLTAVQQTLNDYLEIEARYTIFQGVRLSWRIY